MKNQELEKIKSIIKDCYKSGRFCYYWEYFEVFGLTNKQAKELLEFYNDLAFEIEV